MNTDLFTLYSDIEKLLTEKPHAIIAIDGPCASGKTSLAEALSHKYGGVVFHMDDFFLQMHQKTLERLNEPGGNVDRERFYSEVLLPLRDNASFSYCPYKCSDGCFSEPVSVSPHKLSIIEGSYCMHPELRPFYDYSVFLCVSPQMQKDRIMLRPKHKHEAFFTRWIPMEEQYFNFFNIPEQCNIRLQF